MQEELRDAFRQMYNVPNPHDFQMATAEKLLNGKSVILQAPTGSGKTRAALFPFLHAWQLDLPFPRKCLYAVPLRVLATQFKEDVAKDTQDWSNSPKIRLQTGEQQEDPTFEGDLIFTTIDQVLSSALSVPYSLGHRRANMNAGAVFSSYLVCDELHLFPIDESSAQGALATLIELLSTFKGYFPFLLMTATLSQRMLAALGQELGAELVVVPEVELEKIGSQQKTRRYHMIAEPLTAAKVLSQHRSRSIVICNQVQRAISLYDDICQGVEADTDSVMGKAEVVLLHAQFVKSHRRTKENTIRQQFGKPDADAPRTQSLIVVATQAIEVGLDITCEHLHTELAPANAIVQRAGRCARYEGEDGDVFIYEYYQLPDPSKHPNLPYNANLCDETRRAFGEEQYDGKPLMFRDEQEIVSTVHGASDARLIGKVIRESETRWHSMSAAMFRGDTTGRATLIRKVDSRTLLVHDKPEQIRYPYAWRGFSIFHGTLRNWLNKLDGAGTDWILRFPVEVRDESEESRKAPTYKWDYVQSASQINVSPIFVVHPDLVAYDRYRGFRLAPAETAIKLAELEQEPPSADKARFVANYQLESYAEHIGKMLDYYRTSGLYLQIALAGQRLAHSLSNSISAEQFERAMLLALALHDVGKLQVEWQEWSHTYQQVIGELPDPGMMIVHTHYEPEQHPEHAQAEKAVPIKRPHHAAEGAYASWPILQHALGGDEWMSQVVFTAIARHHAPFVDGVEAYTLHLHSTDAIAEALALIGMPESHAAKAQLACGSLSRDGALLDRLIFNDDPAQWLVYTLIVRTLRLCDGHALEGEV